MTSKTNRFGAAGAAVTAVGLAVSIAAPAEGYVAYVYRDPVGVLTYCYGETLKAKDMVGRRFSEQECRALLEKRMAHYDQGNAGCISAWSRLHVYVRAAFNDFSYNVGVGAFCASTAAKLLQAGRVRDACGQLTRWIKGRVNGKLVVLPGLLKRRALEQTYCLKGAA